MQAPLYGARMFKMTEDTYHAARDEYLGLCLSCKSWRESTEPDAENYRCGDCGRKQVQGIDNLLICGQVEIVEPGEEDTVL